MSFLSISKNVQNALNNNKPVVALESTIISHGMPYPQNLQTAEMLEDICKQNGVEPATICLMNGQIKIGLTNTELEFLAKNDDVKKASVREIPEIIANKQTGATTVAATMRCANMAGIKVFATGGIGGVHRGNNYDISADLTELAQTPVIVVCAGAKAILDIAATIEYLETMQVNVYSYKTNNFPAFYSSKSGIKTAKIDNLQELANIYLTAQKLGFKNGFLLANPINKADEIEFDIIAKFIDKALIEAKEQNIVGAKLTPFLLAKISSLTKGNSLKTNIALVKNNVNVACNLAKLL